MAPQPARARPESHVVSHIPEELTQGALRRLGEGIGKVVYASEHWVVCRERTPLEMVALIVLWKALRKLEWLLPGAWGKKLRDRPSRQIRFLRVLVQGAILVFPRALWFSSHIREVLRLYHRRSVRGEKLAQTHLAGSDLIPERIAFPPERVRIGGWPGWLMVSEANERVDSTLHQKMMRLAAEGSFRRTRTVVGAPARNAAGRMAPGVIFPRRASEEFRHHRRSHRVAGHRRAYQSMGRSGKAPGRRGVISAPRQARIGGSAGGA